ANAKTNIPIKFCLFSIFHGLPIPRIRTDNNRRSQSFATITLLEPTLATKFLYLCNYSLHTRSMTKRIIYASRRMNFSVFIIATLLLIPMTAVSQSVCNQPPDDAILTICERESGMAPLPQPQLLLRVYADGRAEYETLGGQNGLTLKKTKITEKELNNV